MTNGTYRMLSRMFSITLRHVHCASSLFVVLPCAFACLVLAVATAGRLCKCVFVSSGFPVTPHCPIHPPYPPHFTTRRRSTAHSKALAGKYSICLLLSFDDLRSTHPNCALLPFPGPIRLCAPYTLEQNPLYYYISHSVECVPPQPATAGDTV